MTQSAAAPLIPGYPWGTDLNQVTQPDGSIDLDPGMGEILGRTLFVQRCIRRVTTPRGSVVDCPNDCYDIRSFMRGSVQAAPNATIQGILQPEMLKEQGVISCQVGVKYALATTTLLITMALGSSYGPLSLTFGLSPGNIEILLDGLPVGF